MDFTYDEEQQALREAVRGLVGKSYSDFETRRRTVADEPGFDEKLWTRLAEMGVLGLPFDEAYGGMGAGPVEVGIVAQEIGRVLAPEPFLTSVVLAGGVVAAAGTEEQKASLLEAVGSGETVLAFAHAEPGTRWGSTAAAVTASGSGDEWTLTGVKEPVPFGARADQLVVSARLDDGGTGLFLVAGDAPGLTRSGYADLRRRPRRPGRVGRHPRHSARRGRRRVRAHRPGARRRPDRGLQRGGRRHAVRADRHLGVPQEPQAVRRAAQDLPGADVPGRRHVRLARARDQRRDLGDDGARVRHRRRGRRGGRPRRAAGQPASRHVGQEAIQLHGGIAMTAEYSVGSYTSHLTALDHLFGDGQLHLSALSAAVGDHDEVDPLP